VGVWLGIAFSKGVAALYLGVLAARLFPFLRKQRKEISE
jgi:hypothetical protein